MAFTTYLFDVTGEKFKTEINQIIKNLESSPHISSALINRDDSPWRHAFSEDGGIELSDDLVVTSKPNIGLSDVYSSKQQISSPTEDDNKNLLNWRFIDQESQRRFIVVEIDTNGKRFEVFESTGIALVLSGGAPQSTLTAGTLCALIDCKVEFDAIFTSGAGVLMGLLLVAPKGASPKEALTNTIEMGVSDEIHDRFPFGYKTFFKPGPFTRRYRQWGDFYKYPLPFPVPPRADYESRRFYREWSRQIHLYNDWVDWWVSAATPSTLSPRSQGLFEPLPFLEELIDLDKVNRLFPGEFYMNAFNITDSKMEYFDNVGENEIIFDHVRAAFALPFFYPPYEMDNGQVYIEGATRDPLSFGNLKDRVDSIDIKNVVVVDLLDSLDRVLVREPYDLQDAYAISVMTPAIALAERTLEDLQKSHPEIPINRIKFNITARHDHQVLEWSRSNLKHLWQVGYNAGIEFYNDEENKGKNKKLLTRNPPPKRTPPRANNRDNAEE